jgi:DNA-binding winged helix-turn-helix (wHTH) protein
MTPQQAFVALPKPNFPRILVSTKSLFKDDDILVFNVREKTLSRGCFLVNLSSYSLVFRVLRALVLRAPRVVSFEDLIELVWNGSVEGGPLTAIATLKNAISAIKKKRLLESLGLEITSAYGRGYALNEISALRDAA